MLQTLLRTLLLATVVGCAHAQQAGMNPLPSSLVKGSELVDSKSGFAVRINQPNMTWSVASGLGPEFSKYIGVDKERRLVYTLFVDRRRYSEQTEERAGKYSEGLKAGLRQGGWRVERSTISPASVPRKNSYRFSVEATHVNGAKATFVEYVTSPDNLYSIGVVLPAGADEHDFEAFLQTFRLLK